MTQTAPQLVPNWIPETLRRDLIRRHMSYGEEAMRARRFASPSREEEYRLLFPPALAFTPRGWPVEARHPFIDRRLIEFAFAIPPDLKFDVDSTTDAWYARAKKLMRDGLRGILPEVISGRTTKTLFDTTAVSSFARYWGDYVQMFGPGSRPEIVARGYVDGERFFRRLTAMRERRWPGDANYVEIFLGLEVWLRSVRQPRASHLQVRSDWRPVSRAV